MKFVIGSELYDHLEKVVDRFEDVANEINSHRGGPALNIAKQAVP